MTNSNPDGTARLNSILITVLTVLPAFWIFVWHASSYAPWLIDDAGISFAYAKNLASGHGLVSQAGMPPVEGFSNPLWTFLIAILYRADLFSVPATPKLISHLLVFIGFFAIATSVRKMVKSPDWLIVAGASLVLCAANPGFVIWSVSGLENPLMACLGACLLLVSVIALTKPEQVGHTLPVYGGLLAAALALTRPDGIVYAIAFPTAVALGLRSPQTIKAALRPLLLYGASMAIPLGGYLVFRFAYFGDWLPNTYYAKPGTSLAGLADLVKFSGLSSAVLPFFPLATPIAIAVSTLLIVLRTNLEYPRYLHLVTLFLVLGLGAYLALPEDWMGEYRFGTLTFLFAYLLLFLILQFALANLVANMLVVRMALLLAFSLTLIILSSAEFNFRASHFSNSPTTPLENVARSYWRFNELATQLGLRNPSLLVPDLGGTLIFSRIRVIDLAGLCDRDIGRLFHRRATPSEFSKDITGRIKPDFVHIHGWWARVSGLKDSNEFASAYISLGGGNYVRRKSLPKGLADQDVQRLYKQLKGPPPISAMHAFPLLEEQ